MNDPAFANKRQVWVFTTEKECPLKLGQLIVYSYLAYQDRYDDCPSLRNLCTATGLGYKSCRSAVAALEEHGVVDGVVVKPPPDGWFKQKRSIKPGSHFSMNYATWTFNVPASSKPLTYATVALYSFLRHCVVTKYMPREGWSKSYFATVLRCKRETVFVALEKLKKARFLDYNTDLEIKLYELNAEQMKLFADKPVKPERKPKVEFVDEPAPSPNPTDSPTSDEPSYFKRLVWLFEAEVSRSEAEKLAREIRDNTRWNEFDEIIYGWIKEKLSATVAPETKKWVRWITELAEVGELEKVIYEQWKSQQQDG